MKKLAFLLALLLMPTVTIAGPVFYISGAANVFIPSDSELTVTDPAFQNFLDTNGITTENKFETGFGGDVAIGVQLFKRFRVEGEYSYKTTDLDKQTATVGGISADFPFPGEVDAHSFMVNGIFDIRNSSRFTPYVGVGAGVSLVTYSNPTFSTQIAGLGTFVTPAFEDDNTVFAYQVFAGVGYWITRQIVGFVQYKYHGASDVTIGDTIAEFASHNIGAGVRIYFGKP